MSRLVMNTDYREGRVYKESEVVSLITFIWFIFVNFHLILLVDLIRFFLCITKLLARRMRPYESNLTEKKEREMSVPQVEN